MCRSVNKIEMNYQLKFMSLRCISRIDVSFRFGTQLVGSVCGIHMGIDCTRYQIEGESSLST